jgi:hypothetical protein
MYQSDTKDKEKLRLNTTRVFHQFCIKFTFVVFLFTFFLVHFKCVKHRCGSNHFHFYFFAAQIGQIVARKPRVDKTLSNRTKQQSFFIFVYILTIKKPLDIPSRKKKLHQNRHFRNGACSDVEQFGESIAI